MGASGVVAPEQSPSEAAPSRAARPGSGSGSGSGLPPLVAGVLERAAAGGLAEQPLTEAEVVALFEARSDTFDAVRFGKRIKRFSDKISFLLQPRAHL